MKIFVRLLTCLILQSTICQAEIAKIAQCKLQGNLSGTIILQMTGNFTKVSGMIKNLSEGKHGFHIHEKNHSVCTQTGGHYNPKNQKHGDLSSEIRHAGDMGNIIANNKNEATVNIDVKEKLDDLINRSIVVHEKVDDLGNGGDDESSKTGNAGARLDCCVIQWKDEGNSGNKISFLSITIIIAFNVAIKYVL